MVDSYHVLGSISLERLTLLLCFGRLNSATLLGLQLFSCLFMWIVSRLSSTTVGIACYVNRSRCGAYRGDAYVFRLR